MVLTLYYHPFSSFCKKALIGLYETGVAFEPRLIDFQKPEDGAALEKVWPFKRFPVLVDDARGMTVPESSLVITYADHHYPGPERLVPVDFDAATRAHLFDRVIDNDLLHQVNRVVFDQFREEGQHDLVGVEQAKAQMAKTYGWLESQLGEQGWVAGEAFTLADCAAAPALFYAGTIVPIDGYPRLSAYYRRLRQRPSVLRVFEEARPYRHLYPLPWPDNYA